MARKRGEKGKTVEQHIADGTYRPERHGKILELMPTPDPVDVSKTIPYQLSNAGKREWRKWAPMVAKNGVLKQTDLPIFCEMCEMQAELKQCEKDEKEFDRQYQIEDPHWNLAGLYRNANGNIIENPFTQKKNRIRTQLLKYWAEFGMTPISRKHVVVEKPKDASKWDRFKAPIRTGNGNG